MEDSYLPYGETRKEIYARKYSKQTPERKIKTSKEDIGFSFEGIFGGQKWQNQK